LGAFFRKRLPNENVTIDLQPNKCFRGEYFQQPNGSNYFYEHICVGFIDYDKKQNGK